MSTTISDRNEYIGSHVRPEVKKAIQQDASKRTMSISAWVADTVENHLLGEGYDLSAESGPKPILEVAEAE